MQNPLLWDYICSSYNLPSHGETENLPQQAVQGWALGTLPLSHSHLPLPELSLTLKTESLEMRCAAASRGPQRPGLQVISHLAAHSFSRAKLQFPSHQEAGTQPLQSPPVRVIPSPSWTLWCAVLSAQSP